MFDGTGARTKLSSRCCCSAHAASRGCCCAAAVTTGAWPFNAERVATICGRRQRGLIYNGSIATSGLLSRQLLWFSDIDTRHAGYERSRWQGKCVGYSYARNFCARAQQHHLVMPPGKRAVGSSHKQGKKPCKQVRAAPRLYSAGASPPSPFAPTAYKEQVRAKTHRPGVGGHSQAPQRGPRAGEERS